MYSKIITSSLIGLMGYSIEVEANIAKGLAAFHIVGLPDTSIKESKERVRSAIVNCGYKFPLGRITINLAPANIKKEGSQLDLAIAISLLSAMGVIGINPPESIVFIGELALDGRIIGIDGALPMVISLRELGYQTCIIPEDNQEECSLISDLEIIPVSNLKQLIEYLNYEITIKPLQPRFYGDIAAEDSYNVDFSDMKGQESLKRAIEISAAGGHNLLMIGSPGAGKTMAAMRMPTILPDLTFEESIECTKIYSVSGILKDNRLIRKRPFRSPHHTSSTIALIGGGRIPKPGEVSLAHNGVLFLDELPEFKKSTIEVLRQPLEEGQVHIARANASLTYPSNFILITSMNPCPCGNLGDPHHDCECTHSQIQKYLSKVSRPILDRIDIHIEIFPVKYTDLMDQPNQESSSNIRQRVVMAREIQYDRYTNETFMTNGQLTPQAMKKYIDLTPGLERLITQAFSKYHFSARSYNKIIKLARTIADLEYSQDIREGHLLEAIHLRTLDTKYWG